jgi:phage gpG-like protein
MSNSVTVSVIKLEDHFKDVIAAASGDTLAKAVVAGGHVVEAYAKINVNEKFSSHATGGAGLAGSIQTVLSTSVENSAEASVGPTVIYGRIHELGGTILPIHGEYLTFQTYDGEWHKMKAVHMPPKPYLRPAVDEHQQEILDAIGYQLEVGINKATT